MTKLRLISDNADLERFYAAMVDSWPTQTDELQITRKVRVGPSVELARAIMRRWEELAEPSRAPGEAFLPRHDGQHDASCLVCHPVLGKTDG